MRRAEGAQLSAANYVECALVVDSRRNAAVSRHLDLLLQSEGIAVAPISEAQAHLARQAHRDFGRGMGHPARLNFGDCFAYALAVESGEQLLFKGDDFIHTDVRRARY